MILNPDTENGNKIPSLYFESVNYILKKIPFYRKTVDYIQSNFDAKYYQFAEKMCNLVLLKSGSKDQYWAALDSLIEYSVNYIRLQLELVKTGKYSQNSFSEVNQDIYQNERIIQNYMDALFLSQVFWPNHFKILEFFQEFCGQLSEQSDGIEVPCGAGVFSMILLNDYKINKMDAFDISPHSVEYTKQILDLSKVNLSALNAQVFNLFDMSEKTKYDFIICGELLEHIENPQEALKVLHGLLKPQGRIFLTTAVYAAAIDHIYLFETVGEVREMIYRTGFKIDSELILPLSFKKYDPTMVREPINYACILRKQNSHDISDQW